MYSLITLIFRSHVIQKKRKDPLIAIWSSLSPGGSAAVLHSKLAVLPGSGSLGLGAGTSTFVKAPSSVFMKIRNSALESLLLLPSLPACFWKTAIRDSMHRSVSVGLDTFAFGGKKKIQDSDKGRISRAGCWRTLQRISSLHFGSKQFPKRQVIV